MKKKLAPLWRQYIVIVCALIFASLAGSVAECFGGMSVSLCVAAAIGLACACYLLIAEKLKNRQTSAGMGAPESGKIEEIPTDRIDALTGLANENGLSAWFSEKCGKLAADGKGIIVLSADLADFDQIERSRGKAISDAVLIEVSKRVASCAGTDGIAARTSGDEFAAVATIVPMHTAEAAAEQAGKLAELIQRPVELPSGVVWIGGSVGAAYGLPLDGEKVLARARAALVKAKRVGRGHYIVASPLE